MSIECSYCERDLRGGHDEGCPRVEITRLRERVAELERERDHWHKEFVESDVAKATTHLWEQNNRLRAVVRAADKMADNTYIIGNQKDERDEVTVWASRVRAYWSFRAQLHEGDCP